MKKLLSSLKIQVPSCIYQKDPETSDLGKRIIEHSILLIDDIGFEGFTFKKLGALIGSNESSIYRYFENKHKLLVYLTSRYWAWLEYQLVFETHYVIDKEEKLKRAIDVVSRRIKEDSQFTHINEVALHRIIVNESSKSFLTKEVDQENSEGYFEVYKRLVNRIKDMIEEVNADYLFATNLASTILEIALHQHFIQDHFPSLSSYPNEMRPSHFICDLVFKTIMYEGTD